MLEEYVDAQEIHLQQFLEQVPLKDLAAQEKLVILMAHAEVGISVWMSYDSLRSRFIYSSFSN